MTRPPLFHRSALVLACLLAAGPSWSAPEDPMLDLLRERGVIVADAASAMTQRVRSAAGELVLSAMNFLDIQYRYGGNSASEGFDCSGFTRHVVRSVLGLELPRRSEEQARESQLAPVGREALQPGDLVFFNTMRRAFSHVGIYIGDGKFIHAPRAGAQIRIESLSTAYWNRRFDGARRVPAGAIDTVSRAP